MVFVDVCVGECVSEWACMHLPICTAVNHMISTHLCHVIIPLSAVAERYHGAAGVPAVGAEPMFPAGGGRSVGH